jgi:hypothetical protein
MGQFTIEDVKPNVAIDDQAFAMPVPAPKPPAEKEKK